MPSGLFRILDGDLIFAGLARMDQHGRTAIIIKTDPTLLDVADAVASLPDLSLGGVARPAMAAHR